MPLLKCTRDYVSDICIFLTDKYVNKHFETAVNWRRLLTDTSRFNRELITCSF